MTELKFSFDLGTTLDIQKVVNKQVFPLLNQAVRAVAAKTAADWKSAVYGAKLWSGEKDAYAETIKWKMTGDFTAEVQSNYKYDKEIEYGRPSRDLKAMLDTSLKVRRTESGKRFLVIPIRHNVQKLKDAGIYESVSELTASMVTGQAERLSGEVTRLIPNAGMSAAPAKQQTMFLSSPQTKQAQTVRQNIYAWGERLKAQSMKDAGVPLSTRKWAQGLHRFDTSTPGGAKSSAFLTFRIMMEGSGGWIVPAQPGQHLAQGVVAAMQPKAQAAFAEAIRRTLKPK